MIQILHDKENKRLLAQNYIGQLAYVYKNAPYVVPITYYFDQKRNCIIGYSAEGQKITAMRKNNQVAMQVSEIASVNHWNCILVHGKFEEIHGSEAKAYLHDFSLGVKELIIHKEQRKLDFISEFSSKIYKGDLPIVFLIHIQEITGRMRRS